MERAIALVLGPQHITKIPFALARNIEKQDIATVRCIRSKKCINFIKKILFLKNKFVYLQCEKEMLSRCEGPKLLGNPTEYNSFRPRFSGSNPEGGTFFTEKLKIF